MQSGTVEIRFNDHVIKAKMIELNIEHDVMRLGTTYRITAIDNYLTQIISEEENPMSDLQTTIRTADLDETTKMLRERGVEDATGARTTLGTAILVDMLYKASREEIAKLVAAAKPEPASADEIDD